jgi:autotransporter-associated beta strand protein
MKSLLTKPNRSHRAGASTARSLPAALPRWVFRAHLTHLTHLIHLTAPVLLLLALGLARSLAADGTWTSVSSGNWSTPGNWSGGTVADGAGSTAFFNTIDPTADVTLTLDSNRTNSNLVFSDIDPSTPANWILSGSILSLGGGTPTITVSNLAASASATISCILSNAPNGVTVNGNSLLNLSGANVFTNLMINGGLVGFSTVANSLGANVTNNVITLTNGATLIHSATSLTMNQTLNVKGTDTFVNAGGGNWNGPITGDGTLLMNLTNVQLTTGGNNAWNSRVWSNFTGTVTLTGGGNLRFDINNAATTTFGSRFATFDLGTTNNTMNERGASGIAIHTTFLGALKSSSRLTTIAANGTSGSTNTFQIGDANLSTTFSGRINNGSITAVIKSGTGTLTLDNTNAYTGATLIQQGTLALTPLGNIRSTPSITIVSNATLDVSQGQTTGTTTNDWAPQSGQTLAGNGTIAGNITTSAGTISPGYSANNGVLTVTSNLTLNAGATTVFKAGGGTNDQIGIRGDLTLAGVTVSVTPPSGQSVIPNGTYSLFAWGGNLVGDTNNITLTYSSQPGTITLVTNLVTKQLLLVVTGASVNSLMWKGDGSANIWDHSTLNWLNGATLSAFTELDNVTFNDSGSAAPAVNLVDTVSPSTLVFNNTNKNYTLVSSGGQISGLTGLTKSGTGTVILDEDNSYSGVTTISAGTLQVGNNDTFGSLGTGSVVNNATLTYNRTDTVTLATSLNGGGTLVQTGTNGTLILTADSSNPGGILVKAGTLQLGDGTSTHGSVTSVITNTANATVHYYYSGDVTIANTLSGSGTVLYDLTANRTLTIPPTTSNVNFSGTNIINLNVRLHASDGNGGYILGNGGVVNATASGSQVWLDRSATTYNQAFLLSGTGWTGDSTPLGAMRIFNCTVSGPVALQGDTRIGGSINGGTISGPIAGGTYQLEILGNANSFILSLSNSANAWGNTLVTSGAIRALTPGAISTNAMTIDLNGELDVFGNTVAVNSLNDGPSGAGVVYNRSTTTNGTVIVGADGSSTTFDGTFGDGASRALNVTKVGSGTLTLSAASTNTGVVAVNGGTLALTGAGSFNNAAVIAPAGAAVYDVTGAGGTLSLNSNQTLKGSGSVNGNVSASAGSTINPGDGIGRLTILGDASLSGTLLMELNRTNSPATNDSLVVTNTLTAGGILTVTNLGPALHVGDSFQLFSAGVSGFAAVNLQTSDVPNNVKYTWNNTLGLNGRISVAGVTNLVNTTPTNIVAVVNGNQLQLSWPADHTGWSLQTNAVGVTVTNAWFVYPGSSATNSVSITLDPTKSNVFYRMVYP